MAQRRLAGGWPLLLLALGLGFLVERLVVTDTEAIEALLDEARAALKERAVERLRPLLAEDFQHAGRGPDEAVAEARRLIERHRPTLLEIDPGPIVVGRGRAEVDVRVRALAYGGGYVGGLRLVLAQDPDGWRILSAEQVDLPAAGTGLPGQNGR
jgi:hypothetical protein